MLKCIPQFTNTNTVSQRTYYSIHVDLNLWQSTKRELLTHTGQKISCIIRDVSYVCHLRYQEPKRITESICDVENEATSLCLASSTTTMQM